MPERQTGPEAEILGRFEPSAYDLGITDDPEPGPEQPVPYSLTPAAEAALAGSREIEAAFASAEENYGRRPGTAARLLAGYEIDGPEAAYELAAEVLDEWDSAGAAAYQDRLEAEGYNDGPELEASP